MLYYTTEIDTISLQLNFGTEHNKQREIQAHLLDYIRIFFNSFIDPVEYYVGFDKRIEYKIYCNGRTVLSFKTGYSQNNFYIKILFAGLKTYDKLVDETSSNYLWTIVSYLNTKRILWHISELDIAMDIRHANRDHLLAVCTRHTSGTQYHGIGDIQRYEGETTYIEMFDPMTRDRDRAIKVAYLYKKSLKEQMVHNNTIGFNLQRFEVKFQSAYFKKHGLDMDKIQNTLNMYNLMYFDNISDKFSLMNRYNSYQGGVRSREIERMGFDKYRLHHDMDTITNFIYLLTNIDNNDIFGNPFYVT